MKDWLAVGLGLLAAFSIVAVAFFTPDLAETEGIPQDEPPDDLPGDGNPNLDGDGCEEQEHEHRHRNHNQHHDDHKHHDKHSHGCDGGDDD